MVDPVADQRGGRAKGGTIVSDSPKIRDLTPDELKKLLSLVDKPDSDFDDNEEVMGWVNYDTREDVLTITYESDETGEVWHADFELKLIYSDVRARS